MSDKRPNQHALLVHIAREAMLERGLEPDFSPAALAEVERLDHQPLPTAPDIQDLRAMPWCSIDNDDSRDLDQLTVAEALSDGAARIFVAVADVSETVALGSAVDDHASVNTTSVYTPARNFPMLPERLSTDLTSLNPDGDRLAMVAEIVVDANGVSADTSVVRALVRNHAKLAYPSVGAWLEEEGPMPPRIGEVQGLADNLRLQDTVAQRLKSHRHERGALALETIEVKALFDDNIVTRLEPERRNRARDLIEDFMIAANGAIAQFLGARQFPVIRRVVRTPERWPRIVELAANLEEKLPDKPDPRALNEFLLRRRAADPLRFPDLSLSVIKLLGNGEYIATFPGEEVTGHFGLAVREYTHSTAPNRRYPDLITQRLLKAALAGAGSPYARDTLVALATHCTRKEDDAQKVERLVRKAAAACLLADRIGDQFDGVVTGASAKGTWVRVLDPPVEGRVESGDRGLDVGDRVRVKLVHADPQRGYIDFARIGPKKPASPGGAAAR